MANIRCPVCGKENPETLEACQFCGAALFDQDDAGFSNWLENQGEAEPGELPDWLKSMQGLGEANQDLFPDASENAAENSGSDWMASLRNMVTNQAADPTSQPEDSLEAELPDWLTPPESEPDKPTQASESDEELPDWLAAMGAAPAAPAGKPGEEMPDWLTSFDTPEAEPSQTEPMDEDLPDWLSSFAKEDTEEQAQPEETAAPDWLSRFAEEPAAAQPGTTPADQANTPDWLAEFEQELKAETEQPASFTAEKAQATPQPEEMPDWLNELSQQAGAVPAEESPQPETDELSSWLAAPAATPAFADISMKDEFDWIGDEAQEPARPAQEEGAAPANLPDWLQAMRPDEDSGRTLAREQTDGEMERAGPLAGLRDLLPAEPEITRAGKPPVYTLKLRVTEKQQRSASILVQMLDETQSPAPKRSQVSLTPQRIMRWIITIGILAAVIFPIMAKTRFIPPPALASQEQQAAFALINSLPENAPVLVAFEYEPGLSGEMDAAAGAVIDHLMTRKARLALVSSSPSGPALSELFIQKTQSRNQYVRGENYTNLGYISGGMTGLQSFATAPTTTAIVSYDSLPIWQLLSNRSSAWQQDPLVGISTLNQFELTIVITDDPDTARNWIEQVQPVLKRGRLIMVISAQAEPMIRPYFDAIPQQVNGVVTGLSGGALYEASIGRQNLAVEYWDAFGFGILMAQLLLLVGGALSLILNLSSRKAAPTTEAAPTKPKKTEKKP